MPNDTIITSSIDTLKVLIVSQSSPDRWLTYLPLIIAILAVFIGPLIQLYLGRRTLRTQIQIANDQLRATVRSTNRQEWVHILREQLSDFASQLGALYLNLDKSAKPIDKIFHREKAERLLFLQTKIELLLNPEKPDQKEIIDLVDEARRAAISRQLARLELFINEITKKSQALLNLTWQRIKKLE